MIGVAEDANLIGVDPGNVDMDDLTLGDLDIGDGIELELSGAGNAADTPVTIDGGGRGSEDGLAVDIDGNLDLVMDDAALSVDAELSANDLALTDEAAGAGTGCLSAGIPGAQADNDALADAYLRSVLPGFGRESINLSPGAGRKGLEKKNLKGSLALYDALKPLIVEVAEGKRTSTRFEFDSAALGIADRWTAEALGFASLEDEGVWNAVFQKEGIDLSALMKALREASVSP